MSRIIVKGKSAEEMINEEILNIEFYRNCIQMSCELKKRKLEALINKIKNSEQ